LNLISEKIFRKDQLELKDGFILIVTCHNFECKMINKEEYIEKEMILI
jgi:hypothetical protein